MSQSCIFLTKDENSFEFSLCEKENPPKQDLSNTLIRRRNLAASPREMVTFWKARWHNPLLKIEN